MPEIKRADWVECKMGPGPVGIVRRVAKDGSWADVRWRYRGAEWSKRMPTKHLRVLTEIHTRLGPFKVTARDVSREEELKRCSES